MFTSDEPHLKMRSKFGGPTPIIHMGVPNGLQPNFVTCLAVKVDVKKLCFSPWGQKTAYFGWFWTTHEREYFHVETIAVDKQF